MHIYKRYKTYWIEYEVDGVRHRQSLHTHKLKEAKSFVSAIETSRKAPTFEEAVEILRIIYSAKPEGSIPLDEAWERYVSLAKSLGRFSAGARQVDERASVYRVWRRWMAENAATVQSVEGVTGAVAALYAQHLASKGIKAKTRANRIGNLSAIWNVLEKANGRIKNPWKNLQPTINDSERLPYFTPEQEEAVLKAAKKIGKDWYPVCVIARHTGLRYGDIAHLKWSEVDLDAGVIHKTPSKTQRFDIAVALPILPPVREALEALPERGEFIFPQHASLYETTMATKVLTFREVLEAAGIKGRYTFHSWRHTVATKLAKAGVDIETRKRILGHTTDENAERYDHDEHLKEVRAAMEKASSK